jgi:CheY-like chemotaxis protein
MGEERKRVLVIDNTSQWREFAAAGLTDTYDTDNAAEAQLPEDFRVYSWVLLGCSKIVDETCEIIGTVAAQGVPILVAHVFSESGDLRRAFLSGATDVIQKPFSVEFLKHTSTDFEALLAKRQSNRQ